MGNQAQKPSRQATIVKHANRQKSKKSHFDRKKSKIDNKSRRRVMQAQDTFINSLVRSVHTHEHTHEHTHGHKHEHTHENGGVILDEGDRVSLGPDVINLDGTTTTMNRSKSLRSATSLYDEIDAKTLSVDLAKYIFPFENLVFEGGGSKGLAYCGAVRVMEKYGIMPNIKRFAGASAGAMASAMLAVGYDSYAIEEFFGFDMTKIFIDHSCGYFSLLPNLVKGFGWNPAKRVYKWLGAILYEMTGNEDITFSEVYEQLGKEICIVVTNLNMLNTEYFHPKTTPDVPVRFAVRMSMSIPGLFKAPKFKEHGEENIYVDGGVLCNYPINCFDGWWLSMKMEDSFLNRLQPLEEFQRLFEKKERFGTYNDKTLGFSLYADNERDILRGILQQRDRVELPEYPKTKLATEKANKKRIQEKAKLEHTRTMHAVSAFLKALQKHNTDMDDKISKDELMNALNDRETLPQRYIERLFGKNVTVDEAMEALDVDQDGEVYYHEIVHFIERTGISLQNRFLGYQRKEIKGLFSFFETLQSALLTNVKRICVEERDIDRTVGINTGHVGTSDFKLEQEDRDFVVQQGWRATEAFLRYYVVKYNAKLKEGCEPDFPPSIHGSMPDIKVNVDDNVILDNSYTDFSVVNVSHESSFTDFSTNVKQDCSSTVVLSGDDFDDSDVFQNGDLISTHF